MVIYTNRKQWIYSPGKCLLPWDNQGILVLVAFLFVNGTLQYLHVSSTDNMVIFLMDRNTVFSNFEILKVLLLYTLYL